MTWEEVQISCKFVTRLPEQYRIAPTPIAVPGKLTRYGLSEVINHLLNLDPPKPFDFLVQGELVRTSLEKLVVRKAISAESALEVEYIPAVAPPSEEATGKHEDWVSAVDGSWAAAVATGSAVATRATVTSAFASGRAHQSWLRPSARFDLYRPVSEEESRALSVLLDAQAKGSARLLVRRDDHR